MALTFDMLLRDAGIGPLTRTGYCVITKTGLTPYERRAPQLAEEFFANPIGFRVKVVEVG